ncbi:MAG: dTDP-glucose 4,6-dehydratase [Candidatus Omnitrophica bacterium]|nr:dTDP-glucose 4,6-dehydratase [Candidatus Omnitrophota bacterium]
MRRKIRKVLITGGAGFIGSEFVRQMCLTKQSLIVVDKLTYAADLCRLQEVEGKFKFYRADICDKKRMSSIVKKEKPDCIVNFAAESHVDRSIIDSDPFIETNIKGTKNLLDLVLKLEVPLIIHISTDEVYGDIKKGSFSEDSPLKPNSPYAASKAAADLLIKSYIRTHKIPAIIVRPSNNYGPWQYPEKLVPLAALMAIKNKKVPVYAKGKNVREWLYVSDCARAVITVMQDGRTGDIYNIGSSQERRNIDTVKSILKALHRPEGLIEFVKDRPGHDFRYALDCRKLKNELGWQPEVKFSEGLSLTVSWLIDNQAWLNKHSRKKLSIRFK